MIQSISELDIGNNYHRDDLYALCDFIAEEYGVLFISVLNVGCARAEPHETDKDVWTIKEIYVVEK